VRFRAFYQSSGIAAPKVEGFEFSINSGVKADHIGKVKQTFEMVGTAMFILPQFRTIGNIFLTAAIPLSYESVRRKVVDRVLYVQGSKNMGDYKTQRLLKQAKSLGSHLIVGVPSGEDTASTLLNVSSCDSVDYVMRGAPGKVTAEFLDEISADYVVCLSSNIPNVAKEVASEKRCMVIGNDFIARPYEAKEQ